MTVKLAFVQTLEIKTLFDDSLDLGHCTYLDFGIEKLRRLWLEVRQADQIAHFPNCRHFDIFQIWHPFP